MAASQFVFSRASIFLPNSLASPLPQPSRLPVLSDSPPSSPGPKTLASRSVASRCPRTAAAAASTVSPRERMGKFLYCEGVRVPDAIEAVERICSRRAWRPCSAEADDNLKILEHLRVAVRLCSSLGTLEEPDNP